MEVFKKAISMVLCLVLIIGSNFVSVFADVADASIKIGNGRYVSNNKGYAIDVYLDDFDELLIYAAQISIKFDNKIFSYNKGAIGNIPDADMGLDELEEPLPPSVMTATFPTDKANKENVNREGVLTFTLNDGNSANHIIRTNQILATITFVINDGVETCSPEFLIDTSKTNKIVYWDDEKTAEVGYTINYSSKFNASINGAAPTLRDVSFGGSNEITVDGTNNVVTSVSAVSKMGTDITKKVAWSVSPANQGVTINSNGEITVAAKAKADEYTIIATPDKTNVLGDAVVAASNLVVSHETASATYIALDNDEITVSAQENKTVIAKLYDQYDDEITSAITWDVASDGGVGVSINNGTITVDSKAIADVYTVSAVYGGKTVDKLLTVKRAANVAKSIAVTLNKSGVTVDGTNNAEVTASAVVLNQYDEPDPELTVEWSVDNADVQKKTATKNEATFEVEKKASVGTVNVKAAIGSVSGSAVLSISRNESVATTITMDGGQDNVIVPVSGTTTTEAFTVVVKDQYDDVMNSPEVTWGITEHAGVSIANGVVSVAAEAKTGITETGTQFIVTATSGSVSAAKSLTVKRAAAVAATLDITTGTQVLEIPVDGENRAATTTYAVSVKDQYGSPYSGNVTWSIEENAGVTINLGVVSVENAAKTIADSKNITITAVCGNASDTAIVTVKRAAAILKTIKLYKDDSELSGNDTVIIPSSIENKYTYTAKGFDQYSTEFDIGSAEWTFTHTSAGTDQSSDIYNTGNHTITITSGSIKDETYKLTVSMSGISEYADITVKGIDIKWPSFTQKATAYGSTWAAIVGLNDDGCATLGAVHLDGTFVIKRAGEYPNAGTTKFAVEFRSQQGGYVIEHEEQLETTLTKKTLNVLWSNDKLTYNKEAQAPKATIAAAQLVGTDSVTVTVTGQQTNASTAAYTATASIVSDNYVLSTETKTHTFTISAKPIGLVWSNQTFVYNGQNQVLTAEAVSADLCPSDVVNATTTVAGACCNAGKYTAKAKIDSTNYVIKSGSDSKQYEIQKRTLDLNWTDTNLTYSGITQVASVSAANLVGADTVELSVSGSQTNAGTYTATAKLANSTNYTLPAVYTKEFVINRKPVTVSFAAIEAVEFSGLENKPAPSVYDNTVDPAILIPGSEYELEYADNTNAGTATITAKEKLGGNYNVTGSATFTILPHDLSDSMISAIEAVTYNGTAQTPDLTVTYLDKTLSENADYTTEFADNTNAGIAAVTISAVANGNYSGSAVAQFVINKVQLTVTGLKIEDKTADGTTAASVVTKNAVLSGAAASDNTADKLSISVVTNHGFETASVGTDKTVVLEIKLAGTSAENYILQNPRIELSASITVNVKPDTETVVKAAENVASESGVQQSDVDDVIASISNAALIPDLTRESNEIAANPSMMDSAFAAAEGKLSDAGVRVAAISEIRVVVVPEIDVKLNAVKKESEKLTEIVVDISAFIKVYATTSGAAGLITQGNGTNAVLIESTPITERNQPTSMVIPVPNSFQPEGDVVWVKHVHNEKIFYYKAEYDSSAHTVTFINPYGFSRFTILANYDAAVSVTDATSTLYYDNVNDAVSTLKNGDTLAFLKDGLTVTVNKVVSFTVNKGSFASSKVVPGSSVDMTVDGSVYTFTEKSSSDPSEGNIGGYPKSYEISVAENKDCTVDVSGTAVKGKKVEFRVLPKYGFEIVSVKVTRSGKEIVITNKGTGVYGFTMPGADVEISVELKAAAIPFIDVPENAYYADAVPWAVANKITEGMDAVHFGPNVDCTRAQAVAFLYRAAGSPEVQITETFTDVVSGSYYEKAVAWAISNKITDGVGENKFDPNRSCSRAEIVTFLGRFANITDTYTDCRFVDVPKDEWYSNFVSWASNAKITEGIDDTHFSPSAICSRGQIVTFLYRYFLKNL